MPARPVWAARSVWRASDKKIRAVVTARDNTAFAEIAGESVAGISCPAAESLVVHKHEEQAALSQDLTDINFAAFWVDMGRWSFGYPAIRHSGEGRVMVSWYAGTPDCMSVHAAEINV